MYYTTLKEYASACGTEKEDSYLCALVSSLLLDAEHKISDAIPYSLLLSTSGPQALTPLIVKLEEHADLHRLCYMELYSSARNRAGKSSELADTVLAIAREALLKHNQTGAFGHLYAAYALLIDDADSLAVGLPACLLSEVGTLLALSDKEDAANIITRLFCQPDVPTGAKTLA